MKEILRSHYIHNKKGLTLVELLVSIVLLGILLTSFFTVFINAMSYSTNNDEKSEAVATARMASSKIKQVTISDLFNADGTFKSNDEINSILGISEGKYKITYDDPLPSQPDPNIEMYIITIKVVDLNNTGPNSSATTFAHLTND